MSPEQIASFCVERDLLNSLIHIQIVKLINICKDDYDRLCLIMDKYDSSLEEYFKDHRSLDEAEIKRIFTMICIPLLYIHKQNVLHRDLKPSNILCKKIGN
jgi:serine/threonine protein kinase